jgi:hypothetical protein
VTDLNRFTQEATHHSSGEFTLDSATAWKKMRAFQVQLPQRYACELAAAAVALRAKWLEIKLEPKLASLHLRGCRMARKALEEMLSNPTSHPLTLALLGAEAYYGAGCRLSLNCDRAVCQIEGDQLSLREGPEMTGIWLQVSPAPGGVFSRARLDHELAMDRLELECQDGVLQIEVNGRSLTRPLALGDNLTTLILTHPGRDLPEFMGRAVERLEQPAGGAFLALISCLSRKQETIISNGRVLVRRPTPGYAAYVFLLEAQLDLSGQLVGEGTEYLTLVRRRVEEIMLAWASRADLPEAYRERAHQFWVDWLLREPEGPLADALGFVCCDGQKVPLRQLLHTVVHVVAEPNSNLHGPFLLPHRLLNLIFPDLVKLPPPPAGVVVRIDPSLVEQLSYDNQGTQVELVLPHPNTYQAALAEAQILPPGSRWCSLSPDGCLSEQWLELMVEAARDSGRLGQVLGYLSWLAERFGAIMQRLLGLRLRLGGQFSLPLSALDAVLGRADQHVLGWLLEGGLIVGLGELEGLEFLPTREGGRRSLRQLQAMPKVWINQDQPDSLLVPPQYLAGLQQFLGASRHGAGAWGSRSEQSGHGL